MEQNVIDTLYEDLKVDIKPGGQGFKYVKTSYVIDRLNKAFKNNWGTEVKSVEMFGDEMLVRVMLTAYVAKDHEDQTMIVLQQEGFGSAKKFGNTEVGNLAKSALSKAIKNAARNWGVGLFLDEGTADSGSAPPSGMPSGNIPNMGGMPNMGSTPNTPPTGGMPNMPPQNSAPQTFNQPNAAVPPVANTMPGMPSTPPAGNNAPPSGLPQMGATPNAMPPSAPSNVPPQTPSSAPSVAPPPESVPSTGGPTKITAVQKVAVESRLQEKGLSFEQSATEFFGALGKPVPVTIDEIDYEDAISFVTALNSK